MHGNIQTGTALLIFALITLSTGVALAGPLDKVQFIKIAAKDAKAVIKAADGKLYVIKAGDVVGEGATVKEIAAGRIVLEEQTDLGRDTIIVRMMNDKPTIERLRKQQEKAAVLAAPLKSGN